jgi:hypothetical protein
MPGPVDEGIPGAQQPSSREHVEPGLDVFSSGAPARATPSMTEPASDAELDAHLQRLYRHLLVRLGLGYVTCIACARALMPPPFNVETYTYTTASGRRWTWDVACARALVAGRSASERMVLEPDEVASWLAEHDHVDEPHLAHLPIDRVDEPVLLAPVPDGHGHVLVDGAHRATARIRTGLPVRAILLTPVESLLAIEIVPLVMRQIAHELARQGLLPGGSSA